MTAIQMEVADLISQLPDESARIIIELLQRMIPDTDKPIKEVDVSKRIGVAKGKYVVPEDIDWCNNEIAEMFGV